MKVSVVTPVKDEAATLPELIGAIRSQTRAPEEWIAVDGGSSDRSLDILRQTDACTALAVPGNISRGRNAGIAAASGDIIATVDAGCRPRRDWLERLVEPLEAGTARVAAGSTRPRIESPFDAAQAALLDQFVLPGLSGSGGRQPALSARCLAFRRDLWAQQPFPEWLDHGEDAWLLHRWAQSGNPVTVVPEAIVEWRQRSSLAGFVKQHFHYMRGDGRAAMNTHRHLLRWGFYASLAAMLLLAVRVPALGWAAAGAWLVYTAASALRIVLLRQGLSSAFHLRTLLLLIVMLPLMDAAKTAGYATGRLDRMVAGRQSG